VQDEAGHAAQPQDGLGRSVQIGYALGSVGTGGFGTVPGLVLAYYLTDSLGVAAAVAAAVAALPKLWDVVFLPIVGRLSDRSAQRRGSRRPYLLAGALLMPVTFTVMFAVPASWAPGPAAAWVFVAFLAAASAFAIFQVPYIAMPAEITEDYDARSSLMAWRVAFLGVAILLFGAGAPALRDVDDGGSGGYLLMGVVVGVLIGLGMLAAWWGTRTTRILRRSEVEPRLRDALHVARTNRSYVVLWTAFVLQAMATGAMLAAAQYFATYVIADEKLITLLFVCLIGPALVVMPVWARLSRRLGKRQGYLRASATFLAGTLLLLAGRQLPTAAVCLAVALCGLGYAGMQMFPLSMLPDTIQEDAMRSGRSRAGVYTGLWTAGETLGFALGPALVLGLLAVTGFVSSRADEAVAQPDSAVLGVLLTFSALPAALLAASVPFVRRYDLTRERLDSLTAQVAPAAADGG
jgi:Na+/melibiose symporter-like transporter